jgi:hypothetical protein
MARVRLLLVLAVFVACRPEPPRPSPPFTRELEVIDLGDGDCVIGSGGVLHCADPSREPAGTFSFSAVEVGVLNSYGARCGVTKDQHAVCWGCQTSSGVNLRAPPLTLPLGGVKQVAVGRSFACALRDSGKVWCWGPDEHQRDVIESDHQICSPYGEPTPVAALPPAVRFAMTMDGRICVLTASGEVHCNGVYHLPDDPLLLAMTAPPEGKPRLVPKHGVERLELGKTRDIVAGNEHFCALGFDGSVTCWDENKYGQSGAPTEQCVEYLYGGCKVKPTRVALDGPAVAVAAGDEHSCAILDGGDVACWGNNEHDALGFSSDEVCHPFWRGYCDVTPRRVPGLSDVTQLFLSRSLIRTWALTDAGRVVVWPEPLPRGGKPRRIAPCRNVEGALTAEQATAREKELGGTRVRVRGTVSLTSVAGRPHAAVGNLLLHPGAGEQGLELIVDGKLTRFYVGQDQAAPLGIYVYDACRPSP